jgi:hypothetical protein
MQRKILAAIGSIVLAFTPVLASSVTATDTAGDSKWPTSLEEERQLYAFEEAARSGGALGFYRDEATSSLVVLIPRSVGATFDPTALGTAPVPVMVKIADVDPGDLQAARDKLDRLPEQAPAGESMAYFFNPSTQKIDVTTSIAAAELSRMLGDSWDLIDYHYGDVTPAANRQADSSPFKGGAAITAGGSSCTSGFTVVNGAGRRGLVAPAHCYNAGQQVTTPPGTVVGTTENRHCGPNDNNDVELIAGKSYTNKIYILSAASSTAAPVTQAGDPAVGSTYNFSGAVSGEKSNQVVLDVDARWWVTTGWCGDNTFWVLHLIAFARSGVCDVQLGDSGAPFYFKWTTTQPTIGIRGMVVAKSVDGHTCYAMKYSRIANALGYWIYTG